ncbi:MAG: adenylate/guanylate cyclase domain-containing protein [Syntrophales bacterium]
MTTQEVKRKLTVILSADVKGYSRLMGEDEKGTVRTLNAYKEVMAVLIENHHGRVVDAIGDNLMAEFASVVDAVECAVEIQKELKTRNAELPENRRMEFRIGVNLGDVIENGDRIFGDGLNIAARLESLSEAGGICISGTAFDQVKNKLNLGYKYLGEQAVKNILEPVRVYRVLMEPEAVGKVLGEKKTKPGQWEKTAYPLPDRPSIAVLPFVNMSGDPAQEYFCDGMTDQIITSLSMIPRLFVIARNSTFVYKGKAVDVQKVSKEQGVRYVLEGSIQKSEDRVRILVQLIDTIKGDHLWSERYDRNLRDIFALQDDIAMKVMTAIQVQLTEGEYLRAIAGGTSNLKALESFWRGIQHFFRSTKEDNTLARQWLQEALDLDPNFANAWSLMGWTYGMDVTLGGTESPVQSMKTALECGQKAIRLDDSCAQAYALVGWINILQRRFDEAIENGEKAVRLNPNDPHVLFILAGIMQVDGRFDESIALVKNAMRLCPYYPAMYLQRLFGSYFLAGSHDEALAAGELLLARADKGEFNPLLAHVDLAEAYIALGQDDKARAHAEEVLKIDPNFSLAAERKKFYYFKDPAHPERFIDALRKAGLK